MNNLRRALSGMRPLYVRGNQEWWLVAERAHHSLGLGIKLEWSPNSCRAVAQFLLFKVSLTKLYYNSDFSHTQSEP